MIHHSRDSVSSPPTPRNLSVDPRHCPWQGLCLLQLKELLTCMSTSCLIILPSAHLSIARASPRNMGTRSCRKAKKDTSYSLSQEKVPADLKNQHLGPTGPLLKCSFPPSPLSHLCPKRRYDQREQHSPLPQALLTHQQSHVETITLLQELGPVTIYGSLHLQKAKPCRSEKCPSKML